MSSKKPSLIGQFIREKREALKISQRGLGLLFTPPVTTQFISNVERGVTPLPPNHIPILIQALKIPEDEFLSVMERDYAQKLSGKLGKGDGELKLSNQSIHFLDQLQRELNTLTFTDQDLLIEKLQLVLKQHRGNSTS